MSNEVLSLSQKFSTITFNKNVDGCEVNHAFKEECLHLQELTIHQSKYLATAIPELLNGPNGTVTALSTLYSFYSHLVEEVIVTKDNIDSFNSQELKFICKNLQYKYILSLSLFKTLIR